MRAPLLLLRLALLLLACPRGSVQPAASVSLQRKVGMRLEAGRRGLAGRMRGDARLRASASVSASASASSASSASSVSSSSVSSSSVSSSSSAAAAAAAPVPVPPALDPAHVVPVGPAPTFLLGHGPAVPRVVSRTDTSVKLSWAAPPGAAPVLYNLLMNRVSVYSGPNHYFEETGLEPEKCYTFQVAAYVDGRWTQFSPALRVASMEHAVDIQRVDQAVKATRKHIKNAATARITGEPCLLNGIDDASNVNGGPGYVEYIGSTGDFTVAGVEASVLNCQVSKCVDASKQSLSLVQPMVGHLLVRLDDGSWKLRFMEIPPESNILEYNNPKNAFMKITINLLGCRANRVTSPASQKLIGKSGPAAAKCLELNCTSEWKQYFFCVPPVPGAEAAAEGSLLNVGTWIGNINRASMPHHTFQRYEVALKAVVSPLIPDNPIKHLDKTVYSPSGYREPFFLSWLTRLVKIDATPHFPQLLGTFRCTDLPDSFASAPAVKLGGYLPPYRTGGPAASNAAKMKIDGDTFDMLWMVSVQETFSTDLQTVLDGFKGYALDNEWVRAVAFMLVDAVGVGFHSYGLHHNDLLTMSNIRFKQIPRQTASSQKYWCYDFNDDALSGDGCGGAGGGGEDDSGSESGEEEEDCEESGGSGSESVGGPTQATSFLELGIDIRAAAPASASKPAGAGDEPPPFAGHVDKDSKSEFQCLHGVNAAGELPADALPLSTCTAINDGSAEEKGEAGSAGDADASSETGAPSEAGVADLPAERHSWCILADAVDGMQLKLYNFGAASMAKKAIQWWKKGYTFPNTPWYDDLQSVAVVLCGYMAPHVAEFDPRGRDLCKQMREGFYRTNPLHALRHPYFEDYLKKKEVSIEERNNYVYKPSKDCSCDNEPGEKEKKKKKCKKKDGSKEEDGVDEGQQMIVRLKGGKDKRGKEGDVVPDVDAIKAPHLDNSDLMASPSAHSPMTPWIASQVAAPPTSAGASGGRIKVAINWKKFQGAELYNFMLNGVSVYTGPNTAVQLDNLVGAKCYRAQVAAFTKRGWTPLSHALHLNDCGMRSE